MMNSSEYNDSCVSVAVRIRPLLKKEKVNIIQSVENEPQVIIVQDATNIFSFDHVFKEDVSQSEVFDKTIKPLIQKVTSGFNCTAIAYGQTGSGKTYTMGSDPQTYTEHTGIISRLLTDFFEYTSIHSNTALSVSFVEIYNEKIFDLLGNNVQTSLNVKGFQIQNVSCIVVQNLSEAHHWLNVGSKLRHTGSTTLNSNSSRSHAVFTICLTAGNGIMSKFHLVDLAGSESVRRTGNKGQAFKEGIMINKGLLAIGRVINALERNEKAIPYRESMLTTVLQDSLNGKNFVVLIACASPNEVDKHETLATLRFAQKTKSLKNKLQLRNIVSEFEKTHPNLAWTTPYKRKLKSYQNSSTMKKKIQAIDENSLFVPSFSTTSSPMNFDNSLSISTSTTVEPTLASDSPINEQCTETEQTNIEKIDKIVKTHISSIQTPLGDKTNRIIWTPTTEKTINDIIEKKILELTAKTMIANQNYNRSHLITKRLEFDSSSPLAKRLDIPPNNNERPLSSPVFKIPSNLSKPCLVRRSTRFNVIEVQKETFASPIRFQSQRRSVRLSIQRSMAPIPTPAPRTILRPSEIIPKPAPRRITKFDSPPKYKKRINHKEKRTNNKRKSIRSKHYDYVLKTINDGTLKELQMLPSVGLKTAVQIETYRNIHGSYNDFTDLEKMPSWRGKGFERFMVANHLESFLRNP